MKINADTLKDVPRVEKQTEKSLKDVSGAEKQTAKSSEPEKKKPPKKRGLLIAVILAVLVVGVLVFCWFFVLGRPMGSAVAESQADPTFTVQVYGEAGIPDIEMEGGEIPVLLSSGETGSVSPQENGELPSDTTPVKLYADRVTSFAQANTIAELSPLYGAEGYILSEIWVGTDPEASDKSAFTVYEGGDVTFTNNPEAEDESVYIPEGGVVRFVYTGEETYVYGDADVFDIDVTDGGYYVRKNETAIHETSGQAEEERTIYVRTGENGIHTPENYEGEGARLSFGGSLSGDLGSEEINQAQEGVRPGIASHMDEDGNLLFSEGISYLPLFTDDEISGKTWYGDGAYSFAFRKSGTSKLLYAAESEWGTAAEGLSSVDVGFWIADAAPSWGADGHDPVWGDGNEETLYIPGEDAESEVLPATQWGERHNVFFGYRYEETFTLEPGYVGPLSVFACADDDLWAFLTPEDGESSIVLDLGGIHDLTGGYVDLWDYLEPIAYGEEGKTYTLSFFYLERDGIEASCYLQMNLPDADGREAAERHDVTVMAEGSGQTFVFDDGTDRLYLGEYPDGTGFDITSGEAFTLEAGASLTIRNVTGGTVSETGEGCSWYDTDGTYVKGKEADVSEAEAVSFVSAEHGGSLYLAALGDQEQYFFTLSFPALSGSPILSTAGTFSQGNGGTFSVAAKRGEPVFFYGLPEGTAFTCSPEETPLGIEVNGAEVSDGEASGEVDAYLLYRYN